MEIFRRRCKVLDMGTSLSNHRKRRSRTCAVITFGDSYANNYEATKILRALSLPWTFFVSAGIVGTDNAFPHGLERLGHRVPPPRCNGRRFARWQTGGFLFANHTVGHTNLGQLDVEKAATEVRIAMEDLRSRLGTMSLGLPIHSAGRKTCNRTCASRYRPLGLNTASLPAVERIRRTSTG